MASGFSCPSWLDDPLQEVGGLEITRLFSKLRLSSSSHDESNVHSVWNRSDNSSSVRGSAEGAESGKDRGDTDEIELQYHGE